MMFWVLAAVLTAAVTIALLMPLARRKPAAADGDHDIEVYSDQLAEIDRDFASGLIGKDEADYARAEIGRRLLRAEKAMGETHERQSSRLAMVARIAVIALVPTAAMGAYLATGNPGLPHQPLAGRSVEPEGESQVASLIARAEEHLAANPDDGRGWNVLAPIYLRTGQLEDARTAYSNAIRLLGPSAERQAGYGETLVALAGGVVTAEARVAFQSARELEPDSPKPAFYLAMAFAQEGRDERALDAFQALAEASPPDAPYMQAVAAQIEALGGNAPSINRVTGLPPLALLPPPAEGVGTEDADAPVMPDMGSGNPNAESQNAPRGPSEADMAAARDMSADERLSMIEGMVGNLDRRLRDNPNDVEGWVRLVQSYGVLDRPQDADDAFRRGLAVFDRGSSEAEALIDVARRVGLSVPDEEGEAQ